MEGTLHELFASQAKLRPRKDFAHGHLSLVVHHLTPGPSALKSSFPETYLADALEPGRTRADRTDCPMSSRRQ
jgi:hypothetical protein